MTEEATTSDLPISHKYGKSLSPAGLRPTDAPEWIDDIDNPYIQGLFAPTDHESVNSVDVVADMARLAAGDPNVHHRLVTGFPEQRKQLVLDT
ncbi:MAG: hypothetical protein K0U64_10250, partial [Actinomycetia bacterium]|nr:hypothetical protein [Actinomycetes bacterium]